MYSELAQFFKPKSEHLMDRRHLTVDGGFRPLSGAARSGRVTSDKDFEPFPFWKGSQDVLRNKDGTTREASDAVEAVRSQLGDAFNARSLAILFTSGYSSFRVDGAEVGLPNMDLMAKSFPNTVGANDDAYLEFVVTGVLQVAAGVDILL
jgi:hypothetical protein